MMKMRIYKSIKRYFTFSREAFFSAEGMKKMLPVLVMIFFWPSVSQAAFILNESFTTGSRPASWWAGSTGDYGYITSPAPLEGTYSLQHGESGQDLYQSGQQVMGEQWGHFLFNTPTLPTNFSHIFYLSYNFNNKYHITLNSNGTLTMESCGAFETTSNSLSTGTTYHVWWRYKPSTGSNNGQAELWFNTADDRAGTAAGSHVSYSAGTCTEGLGDLSFHSVNDVTRHIVDTVQWADTDEFAGGGEEEEPILTSITYPVSNRGLIGYWSFDSGTSTRLHDLSGNGNHGTLQNMDPHTDWVSGKHGKALDFDGVNDYVSIPVASDTNTRLTESIWFYPRELPSEMANPYADIIDKEGDTWDIFMYNCGAGCGGVQVKLLFADNSSQPRVSVGEQYINKNQWNHIVVTYDGTDANLYLNGVLRSTVTPGLALLDTANTIYLGANNQGGAYWFNGKLDDLRIYNRAIGSLEVTALYRQGQSTRKSVSNSGLVGYWSFNEGTSTIAHDFSGRRNNGTIVGAGTWTNGKKGKALDFANSGYVSVPDNDTIDFGTGSFTVSMWGRFEDYTYPRSTFMMKKGVACYQAGNPGWDIGHTFHAAGLEVCVSDGVNSGGQSFVDFDLGYRPTDLRNTWVHLVAVFDRSAGKVRFYVNGVKQANEYNMSTVTGSVSNSSILEIGSVHGWTTDGQIDDVRLYNRALTADEAKELYRMNETKINASQDTKMTNGLIGMWSFNGKDMNWTANLAYDRSGNNNNGLVVNMSTTTSPTRGKVGQAFYFNGTNQYVSIPHSSTLKPSSQITISAWVKPDAGSLGALREVYRKEDGDRHLLSFQAPGNCSGGGGTGGCLAFGITTGGAYAELDVNIAALAWEGKWSHIVATYDGTTKTIYQDGVAIGSASATGAIGTGGSANAIIGSYLGSDEFFKGSIDEVRLYSRALSAAEARQLYLLGK